MPDLAPTLSSPAPSGGPEPAALARADLQRRWQRGQAVAAEVVLRDHPALEAFPEGVIDLLHTEAVLRQGRGERPRLDDYLRRFPNHADGLRRRFALDPTLAHPDAEPTRAPSDSADPPMPPPRLAGYEVLEEIGRGGMGVVYKARQLKLNRLVALKMILHADLASAQDLARFQTEAEALASLRHPHIVSVYEVGEIDGRPFLALELCEGGNLGDRLDGKPWPAREAAELVRLLALAVQAAHGASIVHRDLKPGNILLSFSRDAVAERAGSERSATASRLNEEVPKITDFGLAKRLTVDEARTRTGTVLGTPGYIAPEQAAGKAHDIGPSADVYSLGAILYELLTGGPPFRGATALDTILMVLEQEPVPPRQLNSSVPRDVETVCLKCLQKQPAGRYATAGELADDLGRFVEGEPVRARPPGVLRLADRWVRRHQVLVLAFLATALGLFALFANFILKSQSVFGMEGLTEFDLYVVVLPLVPVVVAACLGANLRVAACAAVPLGAAAGLAWSRFAPGGLDGSGGPWLVRALSAAGLLAVLAGLARRAGAIWALVALAVLALSVGAGWLLGGPPALVAAALLTAALHGLLIGAFVLLVAWGLQREPGAIALGAILGASVGLVLADHSGASLGAYLREVGGGGWSPRTVSLYLEACLAYLGAVGGALLSGRTPGAHRLVGAAQGAYSVSSRNSTRVKVTVTLLVCAGMALATT